MGDPQSKISASAPMQDCMECKLIGTGTLAGLSAYALHLRAMTPRAAVSQRIFLGCMAVGIDLLLHLIVTSIDNNLIIASNEFPQHESNVRHTCHVFHHYDNTRCRLVRTSEVLLLTL